MSDRKYRQRGYQDDDRGQGRRGPRPKGPPVPKEGPRGRGLGRPTAAAFRCAVCGEGQSAADVRPDSVCVKCGADLHTCTHCSHFDPSAPAQCRRSSEVERVANKAKRNRCSLFSPRRTAETAREPARSGDPKSAFDALFKL